MRFVLFIFLHALTTPRAVLPENGHHQVEVRYQEFQIMNNILLLGLAACGFNPSIK